MKSRRVIAGAALLLLSFGAAFGQADLKTGKEVPEPAVTGRFRVSEVKTLPFTRTRSAAGMLVMLVGRKASCTD